MCFRSYIVLKFYQSGQMLTVLTMSLTMLVKFFYFKILNAWSMCLAERMSCGKWEGIHGIVGALENERSIGGQKNRETSTSSLKDSRHDVQESSSGIKVSKPHLSSLLTTRNRVRVFVCFTYTKSYASLEANFRVQVP